MAQAQCFWPPSLVTGVMLWPLAESVQAEFTNGTRADISIGSDDGPKAAKFLLAQQARFPMLRPLCMVAKVRWVVWI